MTRTNNPAHARGGTSPRKLEIGVLYGFLALMVLAVAIKIGLDLLLQPAELFSIAPLVLP